MILKKIFVEVQGGIGNQFFQYAFARSLQIQNGGCIYFFPKFIKNPLNAKRKFYLNDLKLNSKNIIIRHSFTYIHIFQYLFSNKVKDSNPYKKEDFFFNSSKIWISGYFQSYKYFQNITKSLILELISPIKLYGQYIDLSKNIIKQKSVAMHIRRGDYVSNPSTNKYHGLLNKRYFDAALSKLYKLEKNNINIYVFSDDIEWCKKNFTEQKKFNFVDIKERDSIQEIKLMFLCHHFIISNSSFSWWPAFLSQSKGKIVLYPESWTSAQPNLDDFIPSSWTSIKNENH